MANITHSDPVVTESKLTDFYTSIKPYLGGSVSTGFTPIGTIIAVMGNEPPANFLACNGQIVNIADYKELANYFFTQFGSYNKFGGNGTTTFGIPDLRGEFLRGTGTNSHTNQGSGSNVGIHQDATEIPDVYAARTDTDTMQISIRMDQDAAVGDFSVPSKVDGSVTGTKNSLYSYNTSPKGVSTTTKRYKYTARPTNTSVLYCIATKNMFMNEGSNYSTDEQVVGTWVDGKPIYQKTFTGTVPTFTPPNNSVLDPATLDIAMDCLVDVFMSVSGFIQTVAGNYVPLPFTEITKNVTYKESSSATTLDSYPQTIAAYGRPNASTSMPNNIRVVNMNQNFNNRPLWVTAQYTKTTD